MESKLSGAWGTASNAASRVRSIAKLILVRFGGRASLPRAAVEVVVAALVWAWLFQIQKFSASGQSALAFATAAASSVFLGSFRLRSSRRSRRGAGQELIEMTAVIAPVFAVQLWIVQTLPGLDERQLWAALIIAVCDLAVFVVGRFLVIVLPWWLRFNRRKLRWQLVHAHLVVVLIAICIPIAILTIAVMRNPDRWMATNSVNPVENLVVRFAFFVIPVLALVVVLFGLALVVVIPPSVALSYVVARRMTRGLEGLAAATTAIREGDHAARVAVRGEDEVAQLQTNFNAMAGVLETAIAETAEERDKIGRLLNQRRELVASVSHELRTPLTIIRGYLDSALSQNSALSADLQRDLSVMHGEALRLQRLIDDLFALSRAEVGSLSLHRRDCDIAAVLQRCAEATTPSAWRAHRVEIVVEPASAIPSVNVDPNRLEQIVFNLINNAVRHSPPGGLVLLSAARAGASVEIAIADTGEGIAPDELELIWDRFYRGRNAKDARGSGIGLAIVRELTEAMDGTVSVASIAGEGAVFTLRFPIEDDLTLLDDDSVPVRAVPQTTRRSTPL